MRDTTVVKSALSYIEQGKYLRHRVFFADEKTAIAAGNRPCEVCMKMQYSERKEAERRRKNE